MTESAAEVKYREFESLRGQFGGEQQRAETVNCKQQQQFFRREPGKRRPNGHDPRANAPPLVPLVEEGDQLEEVKHVVAGGGRG